MEKEPSHTENEFQSNHNAEDSSSGTKASKLLALYEMVRCYVVNFVGGMYKKLESSDNKNTFYLRIFTMLGTFLLYVFDYLFTYSFFSCVIIVNIFLDHSILLIFHTFHHFCLSLF